MLSSMITSTCSNIGTMERFESGSKTAPGSAYSASTGKKKYCSDQTLPSM